MGVISNTVLASVLVREPHGKDIKRKVTEQKGSTFVYRTAGGQSHGPITHLTLERTTPPLIDLTYFPEAGQSFLEDGAPWHGPFPLGLKVSHLNDTVVTK